MKDDSDNEVKWDDDTARPYKNTRPIYNELGCKYLPPRIILVKYNQKDWAYDFCKAVENTLNSDPETNEFLNFHVIDGMSKEVEQKILSSADLTPEILEDTMDFVNNPRVCEVNKWDKTFRDFTFFKAIDSNEELKKHEDRLEMMFYS